MGIRTQASQKILRNNLGLFLFQISTFILIFCIAYIVHPQSVHALTPPLDPYFCNNDSDCGCGLDSQTQQCTIKNIAFLNGACNAPDFCTGIAGRCGPKCHDHRCQFSCDQSSITPTPTCSIKPVCVQAPCEFPTPPGGGCGTPTPYDESQPKCIGSGGTWREFPHACADRCGTEAAFCAQVMTNSCDCGTNQCWNGDSCVPQLPITAPITAKQLLSRYNIVNSWVDYIQDQVTNTLDIIFQWTR